MKKKIRERIQIILNANLLIVGGEKASLIIELDVILDYKLFNKMIHSDPIYHFILFVGQNECHFIVCKPN